MESKRIRGLFPWLKCPGFLIFFNPQASGMRQHFVRMANVHCSNLPDPTCLKCVRQKKEGVPQPYWKGTKMMTMVCNHLQVQVPRFSGGGKFSTRWWKCRHGNNNQQRTTTTTNNNNNNKRSNSNNKTDNNKNIACCNLMQFFQDHIALHSFAVLPFLFLLSCNGGSTTVSADRKPTAAICWDGHVCNLSFILRNAWRIIPVTKWLGWSDHPYV